MPNWTRTTYVFYTQKQCIIKDFYDKLWKWINSPSLWPEAWDGSSAWLGNILVNAGIDLDEVNDTLRYRGTLEEIGELEQGKLHATDLEEYYYFNIVTATAWIEMPKMWCLVLNKLYGDLAEDERINFAFLAEEETHYYVHAYNTKFLPLMGVAENEKYSCLKYIGEDFSKALALEIDEHEVTASSAAVLLSEIIGRKIKEHGVENHASLQQLLAESNQKLEAVNTHYYVDIVPITVVSEEEFK